MFACILTTIATALTFVALDAVWLSFAAGRLYRPRLGPLLLDQFHMLPAVIFYVIYIAGIMVFAVAPAVATGRVTSALLRGAMLGLVAYSTYDLTNQATLRGWPVSVTIADLCWGMVVTASASAAGFTAARMLFARG
jgi:uncharacterized membrane protein